MITANITDLVGVAKTCDALLKRGWSEDPESNDRFTKAEAQALFLLAEGGVATCLVCLQEPGNDCRHFTAK